MIKITIIILLLILSLPAQVSAATITPLISYQGRLLDSASAPVSSTVSMTFRLFDVQTGGSSLWSETKNVQVTNGIFNTYLGDTAPLSVTQFNSALWLEIVVGGETLTPRQQLSGSPYAFSLAPGAVISNTTHNHDGKYANSNQTCTVGKVVTGVDAAGKLVCSDPSSSSGLEARLSKLESIFNGTNRSGNDIYFNGTNIHITSGSGSTNGPVNGLGNLIIGYNERRIKEGDNRTGSHNLILGVRNNYGSYGGFVAGNWNEISGPYASISGGYINTASGQYSSVSGGDSNTATGPYSSVSGGYNNAASGQYSSVSGGISNTASNTGSSVSGGYQNIASGYSSSVSGGNSNTATNGYSSVSGGIGNTASGDSSSVSGGDSNAASGQYSSVSGGNTVGAIGTYSWATSGINSSGSDVYFNRTNVHITSGSGATDGAVNGLGNLIIGYNELRGIGDNRTGSHNLVLGSGNSYGSYGGLIAGYWNKILGPYASVSGGYGNTASGQYSSVSGGYYNEANNYVSSVSGGYYNTASGDSSSVSGGYYNEANNYGSSVSGGQGNIASGQYSSVSGGSSNTASNESSSVSGGDSNIASGDRSSVSGGHLRNAAGIYDWRAGALFQDS